MKITQFELSPHDIATLSQTQQGMQFLALLGGQQLTALPPAPDPMMAPPEWTPPMGTAVNPRPIPSPPPVAKQRPYLARFIGMGLGWIGVASVFVAVAWIGLSIPPGLEEEATIIQPSIPPSIPAIPVEEVDTATVEDQSPLPEPPAPEPAPVPSPETERTVIPCAGALCSR